MITDTAESLKWRVVERFYLAWNNFQSVHDRYEQIVHDYVEKLGVPREKIRLDPKDLFELLSTQDLEVLRDDFLTPLKTACHRLFRTEDSTDFLDRLEFDDELENSKSVWEIIHKAVGSIYHFVSHGK